MTAAKRRRTPMILPPVVTIFAVPASGRIRGQRLADIREVMP